MVRRNLFPEVGIPIDDVDDFQKNDQAGDAFFLLDEFDRGYAYAGQFGEFFLGDFFLSSEGGDLFGQVVELGSDEGLFGPTVKLDVG